MTAVTFEITPDLESALHREAEKEGLDTQGFILRALRERLASARQIVAPRLPAEEAELLQEINRGLPSETWVRYAALKDKRRAETLTPQEQTELIALSDRIEEMNVRRLEHVAKLAHLRRSSVAALMDDLGLKSPLHE